MTMKIYTDFIILQTETIKCISEAVFLKSNLYLNMEKSSNRLALNDAVPI